MKTGLIIEADVTDKGLNHIGVKRVFINGEDWVKNRQQSPNAEDSVDWVNLMIEGLATVIISSHDLGIKDSAEFLSETMSKLESAVYIASESSVDTNVDEKKYTDSSNDFISPETN